MKTLRLDTAVRDVCPINGLSVSTPGDSSTVRIDFAPEATPEQRAAAQAVVDGFDWSDAAQAEWELSQTRTAALTTLPTRADPIGVQVRIVTDAMQTCTNDRLTFLFAKVAAALGTTAAALEAEFGRPARVLAPELFDYIQAHPTNGDPIG